MQHFLAIKINLGVNVPLTNGVVEFKQFDCLKEH